MAAGAPSRPVRERHHRRRRAQRAEGHRPARWEKRGFKLTADNRKTKSLAIPSMEKLYAHATGRGGKLGALAACLLGSFPSLEASFLAKARAPVLVICGEKDTTSGSPIPLAETIPGAKAVVIPAATTSRPSRIPSSRAR
jgi:pimeloyl-ACP methyl ester carboxylesterase